ncbi:MAG TPA: hypothetical protein PK172_10095 [Bacteroidales bacterium]|nr:hypothetical protein [Bacteroidales bacterium]HQO64979.1 hypothetical protein [Syntrophorhabdus sp.]
MKPWFVIILGLFSFHYILAQCPCDNSTSLLAQLNTATGKPIVRVCGYHNTASDTFSEFKVIECSSGKELLFFSAAEECYIKTSGNKEIVITKMIFLPTGKDWEFKPESAMRYTVWSNSQGKASIEKICVIKIRSFSKKEILHVEDEYVTAVKSNKWNEALVGKLGAIALSGSRKGKELFEKAEKDVPGGATSEYYNEINEVYKEHFKDKKKNDKTSLTVSSPCRNIQIPDPLLNQIKIKYPNYRIVDDFSEDTINNYYKGNPPCPGIIGADFNGDGKIDYGFLLYNEKRCKVLIIAALKSDRKWIIETVSDLNSENEIPVDSYIEVAPSGSYQELDVDRKLNSNTPGIFFARIETCGTTYFWTKDGWISI